VTDSRKGNDPGRQEKKRAIAVSHLADLAPGTPATPAERGLEACPCPGSCILHGQCLLCTAFHGRKGRLPVCMKKADAAADGQKAPAG
jgi:hypothetical protein